MFLKRSILCLILLLTVSPLFSQQVYRNQEFSMSNENDAYIFNNSDRYYSNGLIAHYRFVPGTASFLSNKRADSVKRVVDIELSQKFYTPRNLTLDDVNDFDRPYAGILYLGVTFSDFWKKNQRLEYGTELGVIGRISGSSGLQDWYHRVVGFPIPRGWRYQIPNEFIFNFKGEYNYQAWLVPGKVDVITSTSVSLGSAFTHAYQRADIRLGRLRDLNSSAFKNSLIGEGSAEFGNHGYVFAGVGYQWVGHNITIQGSPFNDRAPHTEELEGFVNHFRVGWAFSSTNATFKITYNQLSKEITTADSHKYVALELLLRFRPRN